VNSRVRVIPGTHLMCVHLSQPSRDARLHAPAAHFANGPVDAASFKGILCETNKPIAALTNPIPGF
jgi:hypothetical protein